MTPLDSAENRDMKSVAYVFVSIQRAQKSQVTFVYFGLKRD